MKKIVHLTSAHPRYDVRIFHKQCKALLSGGYTIHLVVADGKGDEEIGELKIHDVGASKNRFQRILNAPIRILAKAKQLAGDVYHLHDPELLSIVSKLHATGAKIVFDAHEDIPKQILSKAYLNKLNKSLFALVFILYERLIFKKVHAVIAATPSIQNRYKRLVSKSITINNYPVLNEWQSSVQWKDKACEIIYIGGISIERGIITTICSLGKLRSSVRLNLCGEYSDNSTKIRCESHKNWQYVSYHGQVERSMVKKFLDRSIAGVVLFKDLPNHVSAQPNKMFEYMSAGIPVIASKFRLWESIINTYECGICVDPNSPSEVAEAITKLVENPSLAEEMGKNGRKAVERVFNWDQEAKSLLKFYATI